MTTDAYLDNNVFDFLFERRQLDLRAELPLEEFRILSPPEVLLEVEFMPDNKRQFARNTIERCGVVVDHHFGFGASASLPLDPRHERLRRGFGEGRLATDAEVNFERNTPWPKDEPRKPYMEARKNEADIALGARSFRPDTIVLSLDERKGAIRDAHRQGGKIIFLAEFDESRQSLREFIRAKL